MTFFYKYTICLLILCFPLIGSLINVPFIESYLPHYPSSLQTNKLEKLCESLYESYQNDPKEGNTYIIPRLIHFIWLGSPLPQECAIMVASWQKFHPEWTIKVWTDSDAKTFGLQNKIAFDRARNYGEKSDIFRYEILYRYGGIYIDTDFECLQAFDDLHKSCDFYTGIINETLLNGLIGSKPGHPILKACIENVRIGKGDHDAGRIFEDSGPYLFTKMFLASVTEEDYGKVVALPPSFTYPFPATSREMTDQEEIKRQFARPESLAIHYWATRWQSNRN